MSNPPFQRLLSFFSNHKPHLPLLTSLRSDLSLGLNLPIAAFLAITRHLIFATSFPSPTIHIPSVRTSRTLLGGPNACAVDEGKRYTCSELVTVAGEAGWVARADALGLWMLAAGRDGRVTGKEVRLFQKGEVMEGIAERRKGRSDVLPFWRGGPIFVGAHSWAVEKLFGVKVYQRGIKSD